MLPDRPLEPCDALEEMDIILKIDVPSQSGNNKVLLAVDRASKFSFGFPLKTKQATGIARKVTI